MSIFEDIDNEADLKAREALEGEGAEEEKAEAETEAETEVQEEEESIEIPPFNDEKTEPAPRPPFWLGVIVGIFAAVAAAAVIVLISGNLTAKKSASSGMEAYNEKISRIVTYLDQYYIGELSDEEIGDALAKGLLSNIGDRYAEYYTSEQLSEFLTSESGEYAGIGVSVIQLDDGSVEVYKVHSDTPAFEAGIRVGDIIAEAAGVRDFETLDDLVMLVRGEPGTVIDLVISRDSEEIPMSIERKNVQVTAVEYEMLEGGIGYIYIDRFIKVAAEQFSNALDDLESQGMTSLIIDLRDNPGGDYDTVVAMSNRILPEGPIMTVQDKQGTIKTENSDGRHELKIPMAVLINGNSASASEVFAGAIDDYDMATIIGQTSYGKGVVQNIFQLPDGSGMKFTTMKYYTPSGDSIDGVGIVPDIEVEIPEAAWDDGILDREEDTQLQKAIEVLSK